MNGFRYVIKSQEGKKDGKQQLILQNGLKHIISFAKKEMQHLTLYGKRWNIRQKKSVELLVRNG